MKKIINQILYFYKKDNNAFYFSLLGPLAMGTIHLISTIIHFDWIVINYCIFSYLMALFNVWQWAIEKYKMKFNNYLAGIISIIVVITPMMLSIVMTIMYKDAPQYLFYWFIYAYALYGTIKMVLAIRKLCKKEKTSKEYITSYMGLISALYTIQMMEFRLIMFASDGPIDYSMFLMQLFSQGAIFIFSIYVIILFIKKYLKEKNQNHQS